MNGKRTTIGITGSPASTANRWQHRESRMESQTKAISNRYYIYVRNIRRNMQYAYIEKLLVNCFRSI